MNAVVFSGPTIGAEEVRSLLEVQVLPPAGQGDIYRAARQGAAAIGLIDGHFEGVPSVWHKEILWAMEQGAAVFGSASMGALRAAELSVFGMVGVGRIYEAFASGAIWDDDEVAVLHSPAELNFAPLSEPMVSIRATVALAAAQGILEEEQAAVLCNAAKVRFYQDRTWKRILAEFTEAPWHERFSAWLGNGRVDAKREDAREMLAWMAAFLKDGRQAASVPPPKVEHTLAWQGLVRRVEVEEGCSRNTERLVLDELRLTPERYSNFRNRAALRHLALEGARKAGWRVERDALLAQIASHREAQELFRSRDLQLWLAENGLTGAAYEDLLREAALAGAAVDALEGQLARHLLAELKQSGAYAGLKSRATSKEQKLTGHGQSAGSFPEPERLRLAVWYFETLQQRELPDDFGVYARSIGLAGRDEFFELIWREFMYHQGGTKPTPESRD